MKKTSAEEELAHRRHGLMIMIVLAMILIVIANPRSV